MPSNDFAPYLKKHGCFIVKNITPDRKKTIRIFNQPINYGDTRDLLQAPGVSESNIRASLLKGELRHRILAKDIEVICSDIDLLQFNDDQKFFLQQAGVINGLEVTGTGSGGGITENEHQTLRHLIHFIDEGPGDGFASGAFKEVLPTGDPFPTSIIWYLDIVKTKKLVEKIISRNMNKTPSTIVWKMYDSDGVTVIHTIIDNFAYVSSVFEATRVRTIV